MPQLVEPPRDPPDEPARPLVPRTCGYCAGSGYSDGAFSPWAGMPACDRCPICKGEGTVLVVQRDGPRI